MNGQLILTQILVGDDRVYASFDSYTPPHSSSQISAPRSKSSAITSINSVSDFAMSSRRASSCHIVITWPLMPPSAGSMSTHKWLPPPSPQNGIHGKRHHSSPLIHDCAFQRMPAATSVAGLIPGNVSCTFPFHRKKLCTC